MQGTKCGWTLQSFRHGVGFLSRSACCCAALPDFLLRNMEPAGVRSRVLSRRDFQSHAIIERRSDNLELVLPSKFLLSGSCTRILALIQHTSSVQDPFHRFIVISPFGLELVDIERQTLAVRDLARRFTKEQTPYRQCRQADNSQTEARPNLQLVKKPAKRQSLVQTWMEYTHVLIAT
jgi:hypothetical protein